MANNKNTLSQSNYYNKNKDYYNKYNKIKHCNKMIERITKELNDENTPVERDILKCKLDYYKSMLEVYEKYYPLRGRHVINKD